MKTLLERIVVNFLAKSKEPSVAPKKTLLEQITEEFLAEQDRDLSLYAYSKTGGRGGKGQLIKYGSSAAAADAIRDHPDRFDPSRAPADVKADLGGKEKDDPPLSMRDRASREKDAKLSAADRAQAAVDALKAAEDEARSEDGKREIEGIFSIAQGSIGEVPISKTGRYGGDLGGPVGDPNGIDRLKHDIHKSRDHGIAGAGGIKASWGEVQYCHGVHENFAKFVEEEWEGEIQAEIERIDGRSGRSKFPTAEEALVLRGLNLDPDSKEAKAYIATREAWARQQVTSIRDPLVSRVAPTKTFTDGFGGNEEAAMQWARTAFDGALTTQALLRESRMNTAAGYAAYQSTPELDNMVKDALEKRKEKCIKAGDKECEEHYKREIELFKIFGEFHDTYVVGEDDDGRVFIISISNKKGSDLKDIQANTTPRSRFQVVQRALGPEVAQEVKDSLDEGVRIVTEVQETSIASVADTEATPIDDDFVSAAELAAPSQIKALSTRAGDGRRKRKAGPKNDDWPRGVPKTHDEFGCWLEDRDKAVTPEKFEKMTTKEKLELTQEFMGDTKYHEALSAARNQPEGTYKPPYPMARIWTKVGELTKGSHNQSNSIKKQLKWDERGLADSPSIQRSKEIKETEQGAVKKAHNHVVNALETADYPDGRKEGDTNGENVQGYIASAMGAMHSDLYINLSDKDDDRIVQQMGTHGVRPSHVRKCLAKLSDFKLKDTKESREGLIRHLRETCVVDPTTGAIVIKSKDGEHSLMNDSWRTAGTDQKVDSTYGDSMRGCLQDRSSRTTTNESKTEAIRPLLRSLIVRELDRIKNGN